MLDLGKAIFVNIYLESADYTLAFLQETRQSMIKNVFIKRTFQKNP